MADCVETVNIVSILFVILESNPNTRLQRDLTVSSEVKTVDFLAAHCPLSKIKLKNVLQKGGVWLKRTRRKERRIRKSTFQLVPGDHISLYYDESILSLVPSQPRLIAEERYYSIWFKPAGLLSQGSKFGDHCSLLRLVSQFFHHKKDIKPVHRLDREAFGIILIAHNRKGARELSRLFQAGTIEKRYRAEVCGKLGKSGKALTITNPLDRKTAQTTVTILSYSEDEDTTKLDILLHTGRLHQIRRHLSMLGHPIVGDRKYGQRPPASRKELRLCAYQLSFQCPFSGKQREYKISPF